MVYISKKKLYIPSRVYNEKGMENPQGHIVPI